jgi:hypothetical protein
VQEVAAAIGASEPRKAAQRGIRIRLEPRFRAVFGRETVRIRKNPSRIPSSGKVKIPRSQTRIWVLRALFGRGELEVRETRLESAIPSTSEI